jgi:hypothetical protein
MGCSHGPVGRLTSVRAALEWTGHRPVATTFAKIALGDSFSLCAPFGPDSQY